MSVHQLGGTDYRPGDLFKAMERHSKHLWHGHLNADGFPFCFSLSAVPPTREEMIQAHMAIEVTVFGPRVNGRDPILRRYYPDRGEAIQMAGDYGLETIHASSGATTEETDG